MPRAGYVAAAGEEIVGYIAGHLTERYHCEGEVQYLFVATAYRRTGIAHELLRMLARWFLEQRARHVCVDVNEDSPSARPFYVRTGASDLRPHWMHWPDISVLLKTVETSVVRAD